MYVMTQCDTKFPFQNKMALFLASNKVWFIIDTILWLDISNLPRDGIYLNQSIVSKDKA
jgi:hypothetical protein